MIMILVKGILSVWSNDPLYGKKRFTLLRPTYNCIFMQPRKGRYNGKIIRKREIGLDQAEGN